MTAIAGARITGQARLDMAAAVAGRYAAGEAIRTIARDLGRSYGFVQQLLVEAAVTPRTRGGDTRSPAARDRLAQGAQRWGDGVEPSGPTEHQRQTDAPEQSQAGVDQTPAHSEPDQQRAKQSDAKKSQKAKAKKSKAKKSKAKKSDANKSDAKQSKPDTSDARKSRPKQPDAKKSAGTKKSRKSTPEKSDRKNHAPKGKRQQGKDAPRAD